VTFCLWKAFYRTHHFTLSEGAVESGGRWLFDGPHLLLFACLATMAWLLRLAAGRAAALMTGRRRR